MVDGDEEGPGEGMADGVLVGMTVVGAADGELVGAAVVGTAVKVGDVVGMAVRVGA